ncbi:MAG: cysteine hydrolase [Ruminococcaceae bacterium]|nr:cysteine hydrolase [Oscillospiraceae bacterium]
MSEALLVIDLQETFFDAQENPIYNAGSLVRTANNLIDDLRARGALIVFVQHDDADPVDDFHPGKPSWEIHAGLHRQPEDPVVRKQHNDAFCETNLHQLLQEKGVKTLHFAGAQTELCMDTTIRCAYSQGYRDNYIYRGAHSTRNGPFMKAHQIITYHQNLWDGRFATLMADANTPIEGTDLFE